MPSAPGFQAETQTQYTSWSEKAIGFIDGEVQGLVEVLKQPEQNTSRILCATPQSISHMSSATELVAAQLENERAGRPTICVIENISPQIIETLGSAWDLDILFFAKHFTNIDTDDFWHYGRDWSWGQSPEALDHHPSRYSHLDGIFEFHGRTVSELDNSRCYFKRHCFEKDGYPPQSNTRISYYLVTKNLYLFLVDSPIVIHDGLGHRTFTSYHHQHRSDEAGQVSTSRPLRPPRPTLRSMCTLNRGGLLLPQLIEDKSYSLYSILTSFLRHGWHFKLLFGIPDECFPGPPLLYTLSSSINESNFRALEKSIKWISFRELRLPSTEINNSLHDHREDLALLRSGLIETIKYTPDKVKNYFISHPHFAGGLGIERSPNPVDLHILTRDNASRLESFLMESFSLLMSSIIVQDSKMSLAQAQQTARLTGLATIYLPLTLVTGIFGMNIRELNDSGQRVWVYFATALIVYALTVAGFWLASRLMAKSQKVHTHPGSMV